jgi:hypothetical protein
MPGPTWTDLEARFRALPPEVKWYRLDYQWGAAGEHWHLAGGAYNAAKKEFETLATIAGGLLSTLPTSSVAPEVLNEQNAEHRWYLALWHHMTPRVPDHMGVEMDGEQTIGRIFTGTVREPAHLSATLCLQFSTVGVKLPPRTMLVRFKESPVGKFLWWFGEEPLRKWLGAVLLAGVAALVKWLLSR